MSKCQVLYYSTLKGETPFGDFLDSLSPKQQAKIIRVLKTIEAYGLSTAIPHLKKITGTPFWEVRILGKDNIRAIYITLSSQSILILHGFLKKQNKTPKKELQLAQTRLQDWQNRQIDK